VPGYRYHAFADVSVHDLVPRTPTGLFDRLWTRLVVKLFWRIEQQQLQWASQSFLDGAVVGSGCRITARAWCVNPGPRENVSIGDRVICRGLIESERFHPGTVVIGDEVYLGDDTILSSAERIEIGRNTMLAHGVQIFDNDSHPLDPALRERDQRIAVGAEQGARRGIARSPVVIGERVWIGFNSIVLKGVRIGDGAIVAAASIVTNDVPPNTVVAGNPAHVVREIVPVG
jgi:acetyltransferase-like isoleucine patch superfamily enzyme